MNLSVNLISLKRTAVVAAISALVASLAPETAQARSAGGPSFRGFTSEFDLNNSVLDSNSSDDIGFFSGAIENFTLCFNPTDSNTPCSLKNASPSGDVTASIIPTGNRNDLLISEPIDLGTGDLRGSASSSGQPITFGDLITAATDPNNPNNPTGFEQTVLQYKITFNNDRRDQLFLFLPSTGNESLDRENFINSLSGTAQPIVARGVFYGIDNNGFPTEDPYGFVVDGSATQPITLDPTTTSTAVPEPSATDGLIVVGTLGAVFMVKRKQSSKRIV